MFKETLLLAVILICSGSLLTSSSKLKTYKSKRNFKTSPEPKSNKKTKQDNNPIFVIQKHNASHLHYDVRLEINGVLKSWAVPKGPSTNPADKRLAIETEDHPMSYANFEGIIPEGNYGAGSVIVWDTGTFENLKENNGKTIPIKKCYTDGHIEIALQGKKLQGRYALIRTASDDKNKWLLIKMHDEYANPHYKPVISQPESVISGKTNEDLESKKN